MPNDLSHIIFNFIVLSGIFVLYQYFNLIIPTPHLLIFIIFFIIGTLILSPDLDTSSRPAKRCGTLCKPYTMMSKHRGASHGIFSGVLLRIIYVLLIILFVGWILFGLSDTTNFIASLTAYKYYLVAAVIGLFISNLLHIIIDKIT